MPDLAANPAPEIADELPINLKNPGLAALLAWLWPGAGHLYQGRTAKGILFMVCILGTYFYGFALGQGHVVYASWREDDRRLPFLCQIGVGLPAIPAIVQSMGEGRPLGEFMKQPQVSRDWNVGRKADELSQWHAAADVKFELGTLFTMIAGLLNILAIYDAFAGPVVTKDERKDEDNLGESKSAEQSSSSLLQAMESGVALVGLALGGLASISIRNHYGLQGPLWVYGLGAVCAGLGMLVFGGALWLLRRLMPKRRSAGGENNTTGDGN